MRGRRPRPTCLKLLSGNPGKRPLNGSEPRPDPIVLECPPELGEVARREWHRLAAEFRPLANYHQLRSWCSCRLLRRLRIGHERGARTPAAVQKAFPPLFANLQRPRRPHA
jgi:hypothetical protein